MIREFDVYGDLGKNSELFVQAATTQPPVPPSGGTPYIVTIPFQNPKTNTLIWWQLLNTIYDSLIAGKMYQFKDYQYYTVSSYLDYNSLNQVYFVTLSVEPLINSVGYDFDNDVWIMGTVNNNLASQTWVIYYNPSWTADELYLVNTASSMGWGASNLYQYYAKGVKYKDWTGQYIELLPATYAVTVLDMDGRALISTFINTNYIITPKPDFALLNPIYINDCNIVAERYYELWKKAWNIGDDGSAVIINIDDENTVESDNIKSVINDSVDAIKTVDTSFPDVVSAMKNVSDVHGALNPLLSLIILPVIGIALIPWILRKHD